MGQRFITGRSKWFGMAMAVALLVNACSSTAATTSADGDRQATLTYMNWNHDGEFKKVYEGYFASFQAQEEQVAGFEVQTHPFVQYLDVLNVRLSSDDPPNFAWIPASDSKTYVTEQRLVDLTPHIEAVGDFDLDDFGPALDRWTVNGKILALPFTNATNVLYYNIDLFEEAGLKTPHELDAEGSWTWDALKDTAAQLVDSGAAQYGFVFGNNPFTNGWRILVDLFGPYGALPWSEDGKTCLFDSPETTEAVQLVHDMIFADESHPGPGVDVAFPAGDIGMSLTRQSFAFQLAEVPFEWDVIRAPDGPEGFVPSRAQNGLAAFADAENSDLAAAFVVHTLTKENAAQFSVNTPSARASLQNIEALAPFNPHLTEQQLSDAVIPSLTAENVVYEFVHPNWGPVNATVLRVFDGQIWIPDADVPAALSQVCNDIAAFLG